MQLFKRSSSAREKWHKKALFVDLSRTRIVLVVTTEPKSEPSFKNKRLLKPKRAPSWTPTVGPHSAMEELLKQEQYGLLGFFSCR
jgi:hypothetical protein